jgi:ABC-type polysaccharide/polyol phosphate transport system ATPase subunit
LINVQYVSKAYPIYRRPLDRLSDALFSHPPAEQFWALRDIHFEVGRGEFVSLIGPNGSGKSTLLQIVSGVLEPTQGRVVKQGRVVALLELGAGFNPEFTGRENVYLNATLLGMSRAAVDAAFADIAQFAAIGDFMDRPVKQYSTGMYVRLAFATAIHVDPDVLIVDEALAVGDAIFANRCVRKFEELRARGVTVLFVSHDLGLVKRLSDRAILLLQGRMILDGAPKDVVNRYVGYVLENQPAAPSLEKPEAHRHGDGTSRITTVEIRNPAGHSIASVNSGDPLTVHVEAEFARDCESAMVGMLLRNRLGVDVFGTNTKIEQLELGPFRAGQHLAVDFRFDCHLTRAEYTLTVATQHPDGFSQDWLDDVLQFTVTDPRDLAGLTSLRTEVSARTW